MNRYSANSFSLIENYLDDNKQFYDYGTSSVSGASVFDTKTTGTSFYNDFFTEQGRKYLLTKKNLAGKIVEMTPEEYYDECAKNIFNCSSESLKKQRGEYDRKIIDHLKEVITVYKRRFPLTYINYADKGQEGLHRMLAAAELFGWNVKHPVLVVDYADKARANKEATEKIVLSYFWKIKTAVDKALDYRYVHIDEFKNQLQWSLDSQFEFVDEVTKPVQFEFIDNSDDTYIVTVGPASYEFDKEDIEFKDTETQYDSDIELDDIELDDEDLSFLQRYFGDNWETDFPHVADKLKTGKLKESINLPEYLYHSTESRFLDSILHNGLHPGAESDGYIYLSEKPFVRDQLDTLLKVKIPNEHNLYDWDDLWLDDEGNEIDSDHSRDTDNKYYMYYGSISPDYITVVEE